MAPVPVNARTVLLVEDPEIQRFLKILLERWGFAPLSLLAEEALERVRRGQGDLVITNHPERFLEAGVHVRILYIAGIPNSDLVRRADPATFRILRKPFTAQALLDSIEKLAP